MTLPRSQALRAYREARDSGDTRRMHHAEQRLREATHAVLTRSLWQRIWDRLLGSTP